MKLLKSLITGIFCFSLPSILYAQDFSNRGKEFWIAYSYHVGMASGIGGFPTMTLYITSDVNTNYTVEVYGVSTIQTGSILAGQVVSVVVPIAYFINNEGLFNGKTIRVLTDKNSVVYSYITRTAVSGATVCLPTQVLGKDYYSLNFTQISNEPNSNSYFTIIAVEDNTVVEITPAANTKNGWLANNTYTVNLNKGQIYQVLGTTAGNTGSDLTGSFIKSVASGTGGCKRIAVFSGSGKVSIACPSPSSSDNLYQQLYPTVSWGMNYLTVPSFNKPNNYYRIIKKSATTSVFVNGFLIPAASFINGRYYEFSNNTPNQITANEPISVAQYFTTQNCSGNAAPYDPDMIILNPVEQNINNVTLVSSNLVALNPQHHIHVIMKNGGTGISSFKLDGSAIPSSSWITHPADASYSYLYLSNVNQGFHTLTSDSGFNALAYGYANAESYGYSAGANVKDLFQFVSIQNQYATVNFPATCRGTPFLASIVFPYQPIQIRWVFGPVLNAMGINDTTINSPSFDSTWTLSGRQLYKYSLPSIYSISNIGTYTIKIIANNPTPDGCSGEQEIDYDLQVFDPPVSGFNFTTDGCVTAPVNFTDITNAGGRPIIKWSWDFNDATTSDVQSPTHTYSASGSYNVALSVITDVGCISDTLRKTVVLTQLPVASFSTISSPCIGKPMKFTDQSNAPGAILVKWFWDFGDGSPVVIATNNADQTHIYATANTYTATLKVETSTGCQSLVFSKQITINLSPVANFNNVNICLPAGTANFTNTSTVSNGTLTYLWNFGDGNTSTVKDPVHNYSGLGPYTVTLTATTNNGCVDDSARLISNIYAQPKANFKVDSLESCFGGTFNFTDQSTAANSTVNQWFWDFGDGTTSDRQQPNKQYASSGNYTVTLFTNSAAGCRSDTTTMKVEVLQLPIVNFNTSSPACENRDLTFTDISVANAGNLVKWTWDFDDGSNAVLNNQAPFIHRYTAAGTYDVKLQLETNKGCTSTVLTKPVIVYNLPKAGFISPEICLIDPFAPFMDTSSIPVGTISAWQWNFGDPNANAGNPNTSALQNPSHRYNITGSYTGTLIVTSNQGCTDTVSQAFTVNGSIPLANFTVQNSTTLCSNNDVVITNTSTVDFGNIVQVVIYWDYANDPTNQTTDLIPGSGKSYTNKYPEFGSPASKTYSIRMVSYSGVNCLNEITKSITVLATPQVRFDPLNEVCSNTSSFQFTQAGINNTLPGTGAFSGPGISPTGLFNPNTAGSGTHSIRFTYTGTNNCSNSLDQTIQVNPTPFALAGPDKTVFQGGQVLLTPAQNANFPVTYLWSPPIGLSGTTIPDPLASPLDDITYTLTVTSEKGCNTSDDVFVNVLKEPQVPNIFSPNGDGVHDTWLIPFLETYPYATVEVFNRYGQSIFYSVGYNKPWDGTVKGKPVPVGTYYYIVDPKFGRKKQAGYVDIIR